MIDLNNQKKILNPKFYVLPETNAYLKDNKIPLEYNKQIRTAAATGKGIFYFNRPFMQALMNYAHIKGVKPKHIYYKCNGGYIPDEYCYISFLIAHELLHYCLGDFSIESKLHEDKEVRAIRREERDKHPSKKVIDFHEITNYAGDLRMNHMLVQNGYEQLPMGLFSINYNHDTHTNYKELVKDIIRVLYRIKDDIEDDINNIDNHDGHESSNNHGGGENSGASSANDLGDDDPPQQGDSESSQGDGESSQGDGESSQGDGESSQGDGINGENGDDQEIDKIIERRGQNVDEVWAKANERINQVDDDAVATRANKAKAEKEISSSDVGAMKSGKEQGGGRGSVSTVDKSDAWKTMKPTLKWTDILSRMYSTATETAESYLKPHHRTLADSSIAMANKENGNDEESLVRYRPGEKTHEVHDPKILFVVDESGSMATYRQRISAEIAHQFSKHPSITPKALILKYGDSNEMTLFNVNFDKRVNKAQKIKDTATMLKIIKGDRVPDPSGNLVTANEAINTTFFGGSSLTQNETRLITAAYQNGFNVVLFTDSDIISAGDNLSFLIAMYRHMSKNRFYIIATDLYSFRNIIKAVNLQTTPPNITYLTDDSKGQ